MWISYLTYPGLKCARLPWCIKLVDRIQYYGVKRVTDFFNRCLKKVEIRILKDCLWFGFDSELIFVQFLPLYSGSTPRALTGTF